MMVAFIEGPTVDRDGNVYFTEMVSQRILKLDARGYPVHVSRAQQQCEWPADRSAGTPGSV
jgi:hypothetical protein